MRFLLVILLSLGLVFRLAHLDRKVYWYDEAFTSLRASGFTEAEVVAHFAASDVVNLAELQQFQHPAADKGLADTFHSLATEDNQHPPFYYAIANLWSRWIGSSVAAYRLLPALFSLLSLPAVYWLCRELFVETGAFASTLPCWIAVGLWAISPLQIIYAQESRQYSLWGTATLVMTAALLRALRLQTPLSWMLYALTLALNFYTFLLSGLVALAHAIYVLFRGKLRLDRGLIAYLTASVIGTALFLPWLWVLVTNLSQAQSVTNWTTTQQSLPRLVLTWVSIIGRVFYDRGELLVDRAIQVGVLALVVGSFYSLCRFACRPVWLLVVTLTLVPILPLMLADLSLGGLRSTFPRYFLPTLLGIQLAVVYLLSKQLNAKWNWVNGRWLVAAVCCAGLVSCLTSFSAPTWWQKTLSQENPAVAEVVNQAVHPLLISDTETGDLLSLSHLLKPHVSLLLRPTCYTCRPNITENFSSLLAAVSHPSQRLNQYSHVYLFHPRSSKAWRQLLNREQNLRFEPLSLKDKKNNEVLWRIINK